MSQASTMKMPASSESTPTLPSALRQHSPTVTTEATLFDPHLREALYEKLPPCGRPLSYAEMLRRWTLAVIKKREACCSMGDAQEEYEDSASDIIAVVGLEDYKIFLEILMAALERYWSNGNAGVEGREPVLN